MEGFHKFRLVTSLAAYLKKNPLYVEVAPYLRFNGRKLVLSVHPLNAGKWEGATWFEITGFFDDFGVILDELLPDFGIVVNPEPLRITNSLIDFLDELGMRRNSLIYSVTEEHLEIVGKFFVNARIGPLDKEWKDLKIDEKKGR